MVRDFRGKIVKGGQEAFRVAARKSGIADGIAEIQYPAREARARGKALSHLSGNLPPVMLGKLFPVGPKNPDIHETYGFPGASKGKPTCLAARHFFITRIHDIRHMLHYRSCKRRSRKRGYLIHQI